MILTMNDKKLDIVKHRYAMIVKNTNSGKFDLIEITDKLPLNIIPISRVQVAFKGHFRTKTFNRIRETIKRANASSITKFCKTKEYKLYNDPNRMEPRKAKAISNAEPSVYTLKMPEELVPESKFGIRQYTVVYKVHHKDETEYTCYYKGKSTSQVRNAFFSEYPDATLISVKSSDTFHKVKNHGVYFASSDQKTSQAMVNDLQAAIADLKFFTEKEYILQTSKIVGRYSVLEDGVEVIAANTPQKLVVKLEGMSAIYYMENPEECELKLAKRAEECEEELKKNDLI